MSVSVDLNGDDGRSFMLKSWAERHRVDRSARDYDACPCQLGTSVTAKRCRGQSGVPTTHLPSSSDHAEMFRRERTRWLWMTEPYSYDSQELRAFCDEFGVAAAISPKRCSSYNQGNTHLIVLMKRELLTAYLDLETSAKELWRPHVVRS